MGAEGYNRPIGLFQPVHLGAIGSKSEPRVKGTVKENLIFCICSAGNEGAEPGFLIWCPCVMLRPIDLALGITW